MDPKEQFILRRLRQLARLNPCDEATERALAHARSQLAVVPAEPAKSFSISPGKKPWIRSKHMVYRIATLVLGGAAVIAVVLVLNIHEGPGQIAFAQVIEKLQKSQSVAFKYSISGINVPAEGELRGIVLPDGKMRLESPQGSGYMIQDSKARKSLIIDKQRKTAQVLEGYIPPMASHLYDMIHKVQSNVVKQLPDDEINGQKTLVFQVEYQERNGGKTPMRVWVDPKTKLPVRMVYDNAGQGEKSGQNIKITIDDIVCDQPFDPSLFSFDVPKGYKTTSEELPSPSAPSESVKQSLIAIAQVIAKVQQTRSLTFKIKIKGEGGKEEEQRIIILPEGKMRTESPAGYSIQDLQNHKMMMVNNKSKTAMIVEGFAPPFPEMAKLNPYEMIRNIVRKNTPQRLADEEIGGRKTAVFMVEYRMPPTKEKVPTKVWVDPQTELPLRVEMTGEESPGKKAKMLMYDMVFDQPVEPSLFSFTPPAGYAVQTSGTARLPDLPKQPELIAPQIIPGVGLGPVRFGMLREEIEKHFGKPDRYENNKTTLIYHSRGFVLYVNPRRGLINVHCMSQTMNLFKVRDFAGKTKDGIGIGTSLKELEKAFGKADRDEGHDPINKRLIYAKKGLDLDLFQDKVIGIFMRNVQPSP
jgi:outer membrane lipoprotein-sorting protein